jgi:hypothetical protein
MTAQDRTSAQLAKNHGQSGTSLVMKLRIEANAKCYALAEVVVEGVDEKQAERMAQQLLDSARFNVTADIPIGANVVTDLMQENVEIEILETTELCDEIESLADDGVQELVEPEKYDSAISAVVSPRPASDRPFLVIVLDESDNSGGGVVVRAEHLEAAERKALDERKAEHGLSDLDDQAAGFKAIVVLGYDDLLGVVRDMEMPEPDF